MVTIKQSESMNLMNFYKRVQDEDSCILNLKSTR
jgi:hypothetical protein